MRAFLVMALLPAALAAEEPRDLLCGTQDGERFRITLWTPSPDGPPLHCVEAPALAPVEACAPDGGWGLSRDGRATAFATEAAGLEHEGGWFFARVGPSEFVASASVGRRPPYALEIGGETFWRLRMTLATGVGSVFSAEGEVRFACEEA